MGRSIPGDLFSFNQSDSIPHAKELRRWNRCKPSRPCCCSVEVSLKSDLRLKLKLEDMMHDHVLVNHVFVYFILHENRASQVSEGRIETLEQLGKTDFKQVSTLQSRPDCVHGVHLRDQQYLDYSQKGSVLYLTEGQKQVIRPAVGWPIK